jgi:hypothetical protein
LPLTNLEQRDAQIAAIGGSERAAYRAQRRSSKTVSEAEAQSNCGIDVVALKIAVSQSAIHVREHQPGVEIRLRGKLPIDNAGDRVERTGALRVLAAGAGQRPRGGGAVVRILSVKWWPLIKAANIKAE